MAVRSYSNPEAEDILRPSTTARSMHHAHIGYKYLASSACIIFLLMPLRKGCIWRHTS